MPRKDSEKLANRLQVNLNTKQDSLVEADETFTVFFGPDDNITDRNDPNRDNQCEITILDDDTPVGIKTEITSSPASGNTYRAGETIEFSITFNKELAVQGSRYLVLQVGSDGPSGLRGAAYRSGSGTKTLAFDYTVETADLDTDGVTMLGTRTENGVVLGVGGTGTMKATGTDTVVQPTFTGLSNQSGHKVNGQPYPQRLSITSTPSYETDTYGPGETIHISVNFDQNVDAGADVFAILRLGSVWTQGRAPYASGSGTNTLVFKYQVQPRRHGPRWSNRLSAPWTGHQGQRDRDRLPAESRRHDTRAGRPAGPQSQRPRSRRPGPSCRRTLAGCGE